MTAPSDGRFPELATDVPSPARMYDYGLGGKDHFEVDRVAAQAGLTQFPGILDAARNNRQFLYRVVRFLARDAGITQFLDLGSGLPTGNNVHQVAQQFQPDATVVYIDNDPIVLSHGRALLAADRSTTVITADITRPREVLDHPQVRELLDFTAPMAVLILSVGHSIPTDETIRLLLATVHDAIASESYLAFTQLVAVDRAAADEHTTLATSLGLAWKTRIALDVSGFLAGWEPVEPGLIDINQWRPDPDQPPLPPAPEPLRQHLGASEKDQRFFEFGGLVRKL